MMRKLVVASLTALIVGACLVPASGALAKASKCKAFKPVGAADFPDDTEKIVKGKVSAVTDKHTVDSPLTFGFSHEPVLGTGWPAPRVYVLEPESQFFNIQIRSEKPRMALHARLEWPTPSVSDIDLGLYSSFGDMITWSEAWNNPVLDTAASPIFGEPTGGPGFEYIADVPTLNCTGYTLVSAPHNNTGEDMTLKVWLERQK